MFRYQPETANGAQKRGEPCDEQPQVVAGSHEDGVDRIAGGALEVTSLDRKLVAEEGLEPPTRGL